MQHRVTESLEPVAESIGLEAGDTHGGMKVLAVIVNYIFFVFSGMYMGRGDFARVQTTEQQLYTAAMELYANGITPVIVTSVSPESELTDAFLVSRTLFPFYSGNYKHSQVC